MCDYHSVNEKVGCRSRSRISQGANPEVGHQFIVWSNFPESYCRAMKENMAFRYTSAHGFIPKKIQWHIHAGSWSLVNCLAGSLYEALYKVLMNIN